MADKCPNCGCSSYPGLTNRYQDGFTCMTVYPVDGPHRRGEACLAIEQARKNWVEVSRLLDKARLTLDEHDLRLDTQPAPVGGGVPELTDGEVRQLYERLRVSAPLSYVEAMFVTLFHIASRLPALKPGEVAVNAEELRLLREVEAEYRNDPLRRREIWAVTMCLDALRSQATTSEGGER